MSDSLWPHGLYSRWNSPGQNTGVGSLSLLQGIFPTQGLNPGPPHYSQILYQLSHKGSPRILEWVVYPFSSGSSWSRDQMGVSCIVGGLSICYLTLYRKCLSALVCISITVDLLVVKSESQFWLFETPCTAACQAFLSFSISQNTFKFLSIELGMPSNCLILCCLLLLLPSIFSSIKVFSNESALHNKWSKY